MKILKHFSEVFKVFETIFETIISIISKNFIQPKTRRFQNDQIGEDLYSKFGRKIPRKRGAQSSARDWRRPARDVDSVLNEPETEPARVEADSTGGAIYTRRQ